MDIFSDLTSTFLIPREVFPALLLGVGLSAACGLRLFIPPLMLSTAALYFNLPLPHELAWMGTLPAFLTLLCAMVLEIGAYYVPWLDHALDTLAAPAAVVAGTLLTSSFAGQMDPTLKWGIALIAGGGAAGTVQAMTSTSRLASLATTAGLANPLVATIENVLAVFISLMTIWLPVAGLILLGIIIFLFVRLGLKFSGRINRKSRPNTLTDG